MGEVRGIMGKRVQRGKRGKEEGRGVGGRQSALKQGNSTCQQFMERQKGGGGQGRISQTTEGGEEEVQNRTLKRVKNERKQMAQRGGRRGTEEGVVAVLPDDMEINRDEHISRQIFLGRSVREECAGKERCCRIAIKLAQEGKQEGLGHCGAPGKGKNKWATSSSPEQRGQTVESAGNIRK